MLLKRCSRALTMANKPVAVFLSDVHFSLPTLEKASAAFLKAQFKAALLKVPFVVAGDLLETKANMRAEYVNRLIQLMSVKDAPDTIILCGNHDLCNEKGKEHALNFLKPYCTVIESIQTGELNGEEVTFIPYQSSTAHLKAVLEDTEHPIAKTIVMHQGVNGTEAGEYFQDPSAIPAEWLDGYRIISGHYHRRQQIKCGETGLLDYIGSPYTMNFGEANDPEKGFQVLYSDGSLEFVPTNLPRHRVARIVLSKDFNAVSMVGLPAPGDIVKLTVLGPRDLLSTFTKEKAQNLIHFDNIVLDLQPTDTLSEESKEKLEVSTPDEMFDGIIDGIDDAPARKTRLKELWREFK
jgi:hypothetical protein